MAFTLIRHVHTSEIAGAGISLPNHADLDASSAITIDLKFFKYGALDFIYRRIDGVGNTSFGLQWNSGNLLFTIKTGAGTVQLALGTALSDNTPLHVVCSYDGAVMEILAENRLTGTTYSNSVAHSGTISASTNAFRALAIGGGYLQGWDERLWKDVGLGIDTTLWAAIRDFWPVDAADYTTDHGVAAPTRAYRLGVADPEPESYGGPDATVVGDYYAIQDAWEPETLASPQDIGLVISNPSSPSGTAAAVKATLEADGHTVTYVDDSVINGASDLTAYSLIFVAEVAGGVGSLKAAVAAAVRANPVPAIILMGSPGLSGAGVTDEVAVQADLVSAVDVGTSAPAYFGITELVGGTAHPIVADIEASVATEIVYRPVADPFGNVSALSLPVVGATVAGTPLTYFPGTTRPMVVAIERGALDLSAVATISRIVLFAANLNGQHTVTDRWWWNQAILWLTQIPELLISGITDTTGTLRLRNVADAQAGEVQYQTTLAADTGFATPFDDVVVTDASRMTRYVVGIAPETALRSRARWRVDALSAWSGWLEVEWATIALTGIPSLSHWIDPEFGEQVIGTNVCPKFAVEKPQLPTLVEITDDAGATWAPFIAPVLHSSDTTFDYYVLCFDSNLYPDGFYTLRFTQTDGTVITHYGFEIVNSAVAFGRAGGYAQFTKPWKKYWWPNHPYGHWKMLGGGGGGLNIFCQPPRPCQFACRRLPPGFPTEICDPLLGPSTIKRAVGHVGSSINSLYPGPSFGPLSTTGDGSVLFPWLWNHHGDITATAKFLPFVTGGGALWDVFWGGEFVTVGLAVMARDNEPDSGIQVGVTTGIGLSTMFDINGSSANLCDFRWDRVGMMPANIDNPAAGSILWVKVGGQTFIRRITGGVGIYQRDAQRQNSLACCTDRVCGHEKPVPITLRAWRPDAVNFPNRWTIYAEASGPFVPTALNAGVRGVIHTANGHVRTGDNFAQIFETVDLAEPLGCGALMFFTDIPSTDFSGPQLGSGRFLDHWSARVLDTETCEPVEVEPDADDLIIEVSQFCGAVTVAPPFGGQPTWFDNADIEVRNASTLALVYSGYGVSTISWNLAPGTLPYGVDLEVRVTARDDGSGPIEQASDWLAFNLTAPQTLDIEVEIHDRTAVISWVSNSLTVQILIREVGANTVTTLSGVIGSSYSYEMSMAALGVDVTVITEDECMELSQIGLAPLIGVRRILFGEPVDTELEIHESGARRIILGEPSDNG